MLLSRVKFSLAILANSVLWHQCRADCNYIFLPGDGNVCNVAPGDTSYFEMIVQVSEDNPGDCQASGAPVGNAIYQTAQMLYTGIDETTTVADAINTIPFSSPGLTGTYVLEFNVLNTAILGDSYVTQYLTWSAPSAPDYGFLSFVWTEVNSPTVTYVEATSTSTYPVEVIAETTSTIVYVTTTTVTPATVTSIVVTGTRTVTTCTPTITNTITMTPIPKTICEITFTTLQTTLTCLPVVGLRKLRARQAGYYSPPNCGAITTTTIATSTTIVAVPATWTATDTCYATSIETYVATATAQTVYDDISSLITYTPLPVTYTRYNRVRRSTTTEFITFTLTEVVLPQGTSLTQC